MNNKTQRVLFAGHLVAIAGFVFADASTYEQEFREEVVQFANMNRLQVERLHRDVHADCYIPVTIATIILADGSLKDVTIIKSSTVPIVDKYFRYIIEQAAPYQPLKNHYDPIPEQVTVTQEFKLDVRLWSRGVVSTEPCEELGRDQ